jgi:hypothetical protein
MKVTIHNDTVLSGDLDNQFFQDHPETDEITVQVNTGVFVTFSAADLSYRSGVNRRP